MDYQVDLAEVRSPAQLHQRVRDSLPCPAWYGDNLDALHDVLTEQGPGWTVSFVHAGALAQALPAYEAALRRMCRDAEKETPGLTILFLP